MATESNSTPKNVIIWAGLSSFSIARGSLSSLHNEHILVANVGVLDGPAIRKSSVYFTSPSKMVQNILGLNIPYSGLFPWGANFCYFCG